MNNAVPIVAGSELGGWKGNEENVGFLAGRNLVYLGPMEGRGKMRGTTMIATNPSPTMAKRRCFENIRSDATNSRTTNQKNINPTRY